MIKQVFNILLLTILTSLILFQSSREAIILTWYTINQEAITEAYCINIDKPEKMCNGKCHIEKILSTDQSNQEIPSFITNIIGEIVMFCPVNTTLQYQNQEVSNIILQPLYKASLYKFRVDLNIDHPPQV